MSQCWHWLCGGSRVTVRTALSQRRSWAWVDWRWAPVLRAHQDICPAMSLCLFRRFIWVPTDSQRWRWNALSSNSTLSCFGRYCRAACSEQPPCCSSPAPNQECTAAWLFAGSWKVGFKVSRCLHDHSAQNCLSHNVICSFNNSYVFSPLSFMEWRTKDK